MWVEISFFVNPAIPFVTQTKFQGSSFIWAWDMHKGPKRETGGVVIFMFLLLISVQQPLILEKKKNCTHFLSPFNLPITPHKHVHLSFLIINQI